MLEEIVESLINKENVNVFLARQRLRFTKRNLNNQEMNYSMYLDLHIAAHNIDGIARTLSIQKLHNLLEFIKENNIDIMREIWIWSIYVVSNNQDIRKNLIDELKMAIKGHINRSIHNTIVLHVVLDDFNDIIDNKIDRSPNTKQPESQFLIQLLQLGLYDVCRALYLDTELFTHEK
ncbi:hypothetical protein RhiirC2_797372 [Rhizophagus irregularis]|uniref:Uncharacterized protein n=1 Tax=Rhizophagus irregularis TaxID=588596 RepID=A0A2N1M837_9GLOM|nr:hypothetical protein RhiirC2_797372 [Rhizophagus irregularis]